MKKRMIYVLLTILIWGMEAIMGVAIGAALSLVAFMMIYSILWQ